MWVQVPVLCRQVLNTKAIIGFMIRAAEARDEGHDKSHAGAYVNAYMGLGYSMS